MYYNINHIKVLKFGGSSVGNTNAIKQICNLLKADKSRVRYVIIVSALKGITNYLICCVYMAAKGYLHYNSILEKIKDTHISTIRELLPRTSKRSKMIIKKYIKTLEIFCDSIYKVRELYKRSLDKIMSFGELMSSFIIYEKLKEQGYKITWHDSRELIITDNKFCSANVDIINSFFRIKDFIKKKYMRHMIITGFIASSSKKETTTLGRGGSDYSASIFASALNANLLEIWTDVSGVLTADPHLVYNTFTIEKIYYKETTELAHFGAKVIYPPTLKPVMEHNIPILIKNTFMPYYKGTYIVDEKSLLVKGISVMQNISIITIEGSIVQTFYSSRLFNALSKIDIFFLTKSFSSITVGIKETDLLKAKKSIYLEFYYEINKKSLLSLRIENDLCIIALIGDNIKNSPLPSGKMFNALGKNSINIRAQVSTENNISAVVAKKDLKKSVNVIHETFFEYNPKNINIFIAGIGKVGNKLLELMQSQKSYLLDELRLQISVIGICNSTKMFFDEKGIDINNYKELLARGGKDMELDVFIKNVNNLNRRKSLFVDNTANENIAMIYEKFLEIGMGVITCNKIACASSYYIYKNLKNMARYFYAQFVFEANVGAGLPIISTLNDLVYSGDKINMIEAILSGSLNFIFNEFKEGKSFTKIVKSAQIKGYTEPDTRIDLSGMDVIRKLLILIRECGEYIELYDIKKKSFLPESCIKASSLLTFYEELEKHEEFFEKIRKLTKNKLRFIANYINNKASVGLQEVNIKHPFYQLQNQDNIILYTTKRYSYKPLIIKGEGAGAVVTASGVFSDIIKAAR